MPSSQGAVTEGTRTFLFADLRDYTGFVERHGDQAAAALVAAYRSLIRQKVQESAGAEIKVEGDAVFVAFPSARLAIVCGAAILKEAAERTSAQPDLPIRLGIGVHAGEPVPQDGDFIGAAVNVAARIGATAGTGQLLVSDVVRGLIRTGTPFPLRDRGSVSLKGISEPVHLYEVIWSNDQPADIAAPVEAAPLAVPQLPHVQRDSTPFVGRDQELAELRAVLTRLGRGQGGTVMVAGDAGIGKSRFLREALFDRTQVPVLLFASCGLSEAPAPYEPLVGIVRSILRAPDGEAALARLAPELMALTPEVSTSHQGAPDRDRLFGAVLRVLRHYAHTAATVFAIDDLHWADEGTLAMMQFLMAEAEATPYLVVGAYRGDELHRRHRLRPFLAALARRPDAATIALTALASEQSLDLLHGLAVLKDAPPSELAAINQRAEGNPFFLEELGRTAQSGQAGTVPASVAETVLQRMVRLGDSGARLLTYLAVVGRRAGYDILEALIGAEAALIDGARAGVEQYLVVEDGDGLAFRHALIREAILGDLMARERRALHRTVAEAMERLHGDSSEWAGDIAHNFGGGDLPDRAFPYAMRAGDRALHLSANEEAARLYEHAIEWSAASTLDRMEALEGLGRAFARLLFARKAMATYDEALELARILGSQEDVARLTMRRAFVMPWGREEYAFWQAAWSAAEPLDHPATLARIAQGLARRAYLYFEDDRGEVWLRRGLVEAQRAGSRERALWSMRLQLQYEHRIGWQAEEERLVREQLEIALASDDSVLDAYSDLYVRRCRDADDAEREGILQAGRAYADRLAIPAGMVFKYGFAWVSWLTGNWPQVRALWDAVRARWSDDAGAIYPSAGPIAASIDVEMIGPDSAAKPLMEATNRMRKTETWRALLWAPAHDANVWLATNRAERVLEGLMPTFARRPPSMLDPEDFALVSRVVLPAALLTGDRGPLAWWIDDPVVSAGGALYQAAVDHAQAIAALLEHDAIAADAAFERAATAYFDRGWMLLGHELAWQWAQSDSARAHQALTAARGFYEERGATWRLHWLTDRQLGPMGETSRK